MLSNVERPKTLKETALNQLKEAITLGHFAPGERLVERVLCEQLGVSRTVIRECIRHLESDQLIVASPNKGPTVAVLKENDVKEIYEIRLMLESAAIKSCAETATPVLVNQLERQCELISQSLQQGNIKQALEETRLFYKCLFLEGGKHVAWGLVERLYGRIGQLRAVTLSSIGRSVTGPKNLLAIVDAIKQHDSETASKACEAHLHEAMAIALEELNKKTPD